MKQSKTFLAVICLCLAMLSCLAFAACGDSSGGSTGGGSGKTDSATTGYNLAFKVDGRNYAYYGNITDVIIPEAPQKNGYTFDGWYLNGTSAEVPFGDDYKLEKDTEVFAKWSLVDYSITYLDPEGNALDLKDSDLPTKYTIESETITLGGYYLPGFSFRGWRDDDGNLVSAVRKGSYGNLKFFGDFSDDNMFSIHYIDDMFGKTNPENQTEYIVGEPSPELKPLKKPDYDFVGWSLGVGDTITEIDTSYGGDVYLYAVWEQKDELKPFDYVVDDNYIYNGNEGFIMLLGVTDPFATEIVIPSYVSMVRKGLLSDCVSLESLTLSFIGETAEINTETSYLGFLFGADDYTGNKTFVPESLKNVYIENGEIADNALNGCGYVEKIIFGEGVTRIGKNAVADCSALKELQIPFVGEMYSEEDEYNWQNTKYPQNSKLDYIFGGETSNYKQYPRSLEKLTITKGYVPQPSNIADSHMRFYSMYRLVNLKEFDYTSAYDTLYDQIFMDLPSGRSLEKITIRGDVKKIGNVFGHGSYVQYTKEVNLPETVTELGERAFYNLKCITSVNIPNVVKIGANAFENCEKLNDITFGENLTSIGSGAFKNCSNLFRITVPEKVQTIGDEAFDGCSNLLEVYNLTGLPAEKGSDDLGGLCKNAWEVYTSRDAKSKFENIGGCLVYESGEDKILVRYVGDSPVVNIPSEVTVIYKNAFSDNNIVTSVNIPEGVKTVQENAFDSCANLQRVEMANTVTSIGENAFINCASLSFVKMSDNIAEIPVGLFENCTSLESITLPASLTTISSRAFFGSGLTSIEFPSTITSIEAGAFESSALTAVALPNSITALGAGMFKNCKNLVDVTLHNNLQSIGDSAFEGCEKLPSIILPNSITTIGSRVFAECGKISDITIPDNLTALGDETFRNCGAITEIVFPESVTSVSNGLFRDCTALKTITLHDKITAIGDYSFYGCGTIENFVWPNNLVSIGEGAFVYGSFETIVLPDSLKSLGKYAFHSNSKLKELVVPKSVEYIGQSMSANCPIETLVLPFSGTSIDSPSRVADFTNVSTLKSLVISGGSITQPGLYAESGTFARSHDYSSITSLVLGDDVTAIEGQALINLNNLTTLILPSTMGYVSFAHIFRLDDDWSHRFEYVGIMNGAIDKSFLEGQENISVSKWILGKNVTSAAIPLYSTVYYMGLPEEWQSSTIENKDTFKTYYYSEDGAKDLSTDYWWHFKGVAKNEVEIWKP